MTKPDNMLNRWLIFPLSLAGFFIISRCACSQPKPRLILELTVDQLRGDLPAKYLDRYGQGGFRYLLNNGVVYENAHLAHANTETAVGHAALATGAYPSVNGIVGNEWLNEKSGGIDYALEDQNYPMLPVENNGISRAVDSAMQRNSDDGRSPANILSSTFSDELAMYSAGRAKIFGISIKDRGAITLAGHAGKAFWFDTRTGSFVTSRYYYPVYPDWVVSWNRKKPADDYQNRTWDLMHDRSTYLYGDRDNQPFEISLPGFGMTFPHAYGNKNNINYYRLLTASPAGDEILMNFAEALIDNENLGQDSITDFLSISFSCTDYIDHLFSPSSLEAEDNLLRLDHTLSELFSFIDQKIGLKNTLILLSADHGASESPEWAKSFGISAGRLAMDDIFTRIGPDLKSRFGVGKEVITTCIFPYIYLDHELIRNNKINEDALISYLCGKLSKQEGISLAWPVNQSMNTPMPGMPFIDLIRHNTYPGRSGDIYIVGRPYWLVSSDKMGAAAVASSHGSPWDFDTYVPLMFAGFGLKNEKIYRKVFTVDVAPTLSAIAGCRYPSGTCGNVLDEITSVH